MKEYTRRFWQGSTDHRGTEEAPGRVVTLIHHSELKELQKQSTEEMEDSANTCQSCVQYQKEEGEDGSLVASSSIITWGMAYRVAPEDIDNVLAYLDYREKGGYDRVTLPVHGRDNAIFCEALVYRATPENVNYLGPKCMHCLASQVVSSIGPSGPNVEYVANLAKALEDHQMDDPHVQSLQSHVTFKLEEKEKVKVNKNVSAE